VHTFATQQGDLAIHDGVGKKAAYLSPACPAPGTGPVTEVSPGGHRVKKEGGRKGGKRKDTLVDGVGHVDVEVLKEDIDVSVFDALVDGVREEVGEGIMLAVRGSNELVVAEGGHFVGEAGTECEVADAEVHVDCIRAPLAEELDNVFVHARAEESGGAASAEGAGVDLVRGDAGVREHPGGRKFEGFGEVGGLYRKESGGAFVGRRVIVGVQGGFTPAVVE